MQAQKSKPVTWKEEGEELERTIVLLVHDDVDGEPQVKVSLKKLEPSPSQAIPLVKLFEECRQPQSQP